MSIEHADTTSRPEALRNAPAWAIASVNRARRRAGMPEIGQQHARDDGGGGPWVYWDPASPHRPRGAGLRVAAPRHGGRRLVDRVLLVAAYGEASGRSIGRRLPETITPAAFGPAGQLNRERGWGIVAGHDGTFLAFGGPSSGGRLRALDHDTLGLVLEWLPDRGNPRHVDALQVIERGGGASVLMQVQARRALPGPIEVVSRARLLNVAIVPDPAYRGAVGMVFRDIDADDPKVLREQLDAVARRARFFDLKSRGLAYC